MIKIEIHIIDGELDIEIKKAQDHYILFVILSRSDYFNEKGKIWSETTKKELEVLGLANLIKDCHRMPSKQKMITISDGRIIKVSLKDDSSEINFKVKGNFDEGTIEFKLIQMIFDFINDIIQDKILKEYTRVFRASI